ncbi:DNA-binding protein YbaB [Nocardia sp. GAS34]|uniref:YbaB/EbfC family nucleoid-associated protein n=1 Tax=unclassified Nocardia TaxID=2637762 RepID=UPI003D1D1CE1
MTNEAMAARLAELKETMQASIASIQQAQQQWATFTATATAARKRVTVVVNAEGVVIKTRFTDDIADLTPSELANAVTAAAQEAALTMQRRTREMIDGLREEQRRLPKMSEFLPDMPDLTSMIPARPTVSTRPPGARPAEETSTAMPFTDVVSWEDGTRSPSGPNVAEQGW